MLLQVQNRDGPGTSGGRLQYGYLGTTLKCMDKHPAGSVEKLAYCLANGMFDASRLQNLEQQLGIKIQGGLLCKQLWFQLTLSGILFPLQVIPEVKCL